MAEMNATRKSLRRYQLLGMAGLVAIFGSIISWALLASIHGAIIAPGVMVVESNVKRVQYPDGGIVSEIYVKEGDRVKAGDKLVRMDETQLRTELQIVNSNLIEMRAQRARLVAERDEADHVSFPDDIESLRSNPDVADILSGQEKLFTADRAALKGREEQLGERIDQLTEQIGGFKAQVDSNKEQARLIDKELASLQGLLKQGLVPVTRVLALQREAARLEGQVGQRTADMAGAAGRISETKLQIIQLGDDSRAKILSQLHDTETKIAELFERQTAAQVKLKRTLVLAPQSGWVQQLNVHTIGGVTAPGETMMLIVPDRDPLVIQAHISPKDIDQVRLGQDAMIRFPSFNQRTTPQVHAKVVQLDADITQPQDKSPPFFGARLKLSQEEIRRLGAVELKPGMPAEAFIRTHERSPMSYLLQPLTDQIARTFREG